MKTRKLPELLVLCLSFLSDHVVDAFMVPKPSVPMRRSPTTVLSAEASSSAIEVFLVTTGLRNIVPNFSSPLPTTTTTTDWLESFIISSLTFAFGVWLFTVGLGALVGFRFFFFVKPLFDYAEGSPDNDQLTALTTEVFAKVDECWKKREQAFDEAHMLLAANTRDAEFIRICTDRLVEAEKFCCNVAYILDGFDEDNEEELQAIQSSAMRDLVSDELIPILQQDYPEKWREFEQEFFREKDKKYRSIVFLAYLIKLEEKHPSIFKSIFSKSPYDDYVDCFLKSYH